ncbi:MAG: hypothetical protein ACP5FL_07935 [Thermoplasmatota archaeon]
MSNVRYNEKHKTVLDSFLLDNPIVKPGKMYGHPAYYAGGKLFAALYMDGVCVKVPGSLKNALLERDEIVPFEPMGRKMREWVLINRAKSEDYLQDKDVFAASIEYVASLAHIKLNKK